MDLSLHSFILVVGLVVMAFILWDGIKKVKQSRANKLRIKLDDQLDHLSDDENQLGSEFPNGGARTVNGLDDELHADKYDELEFDESIVSHESLSADADADEDETYVTADLLNDVEQELEQMDAIDGQSERVGAVAAEIMSEEDLANNQDDGYSLDSLISPHALNAPDSQTTDQSSTAADDQIGVQNKSILQSEASPQQSFDSVSANEDAKEIQIFADRAEFESTEPTIEFQMAGDSHQDSQNVCSNDIVDYKSSAKEEASAKAEKLKAELAKISAAKKQLAAKQAYDEAKQQEKQTIDEPVVDLSLGRENEATSVPMLMESVELGGSIDPNPPEQKELTLPDQAEQLTMSEETSEMESFSALDDFESMADQEIDPLLDDVPDTFLNQQSIVGERLKDRPPAQDVLVINVLKDEDEPLKGGDLKHIFQACDLRHGEMNIFHRFEQANAQGKIQFSVANGVEPGTFDPATMDDSTTTGISFFMSLPGPEHPMEAFDAMVEVAHVFARNFNAELHDESHSDLTPQTIEHCRHRIREFCRKQKMNTASV